ncbi:hypothetical protein KAR34_09660 [bacterium]|nr:hypothetical protein [bacterium]
MRRSFLLALGIAILSVSMIAGCRGPSGPVGPEGPAGPGTQTTYLFRIMPTDASGTYAANCPVVHVDNAGGEYSTVSCYLHFDGFADAPLVPFTDTETDATTTKYFCSLEDGKVNLGWINSGTTIPAVFDLVVTVVNP